ncbi:hypothetical protein EMPS_00836 [Entomortierella parvispora]|uniref:CNH domain-containing protein n=1 Tax=Entomortierella parvispora TaxID=205924 RepID=A0A9P3H1Q9_9FUNG|nr:hypothetical protein EMPS_00836 [Entomortierella parvispora]
MQQPLPSDRSAAFVDDLVRAANGAALRLEDPPRPPTSNPDTSITTHSSSSNAIHNKPLPRQALIPSALAVDSTATATTADSRTTITTSTTTMTSTTLTPTGTDSHPPPPPPPPPPLTTNDRLRYSLDQPPPPPYSVRAGSHGSTVITSSLSAAAEDRLFQVQELARQYPTSGNGLSFSANQPALVCADTMHDQQYLLVGSTNALHSIDLTLPQDRQMFKTHIQGVAFKEIHCLEDLGLVVVIAGRNSRVRCYDYEAMKRLIAYGHSKEGQGRVVEGGKLGSMKNMIQLRVETAFSKDDQSSGQDSNNNGVSNGSSRRHRQSSSIDRSLLSPLRAESPGSGPGQGSGSGTEDERDPTSKRSKQRPMSLGGLASLAHDHVMKNNKQPQQSTTTNTSGQSTAAPVAGAKSKRLSQMASYLSNAAASSTMAAQILNSQDSPSEEAISCAMRFTKVRQTKDAMALDFHYTPSTVFMTVLSKTGIDIYSRPRTACGRKGPAWLLARSNGPQAGLRTREGQGADISGTETSGRPSTSTLGGMASTSPPLSTPDHELLEWRQYKQFYHPEAPSFMTVVKTPQEITDIILGKGPRACVINVANMSVTDLHRQENGNMIQGLGKKLGFRSSQLWHSFETIPFDVPAHILYPATVEAIYGRRDEKSSSSNYNSNYGRVGQQERGSSNSPYTHHRASTMDTIQLSSDLTSRTVPLTTLQSQPMEMPDFPSSSSSSSSSSSASPETEQRTSREGQHRTSYDGATRRTIKTRMVTSDQVLNMAFSHCTATQLFLSTYGSQSRIVDLGGKPQSPIVLEWGSFPPQSVDFLKTGNDIYVVGFEKTSITVYSLSTGKKVKEILKRDLVQSSAGLNTLALDSQSSRSSPPSMLSQSPPPSTAVSSSSLSSSLTSAASSASTTAIKYLGRDNVAEDSMGLFFSYLHPKNGTSICKLAIAPPPPETHLHQPIEGFDS